MSGDTTGWVKTIHESTYGELLGVVIVGPHATDLIGEAVVALDAESTIETVADGVAPHPTLAEGLKEAGSRRARACDPPPAQAAVGVGSAMKKHRNALIWAFAWWFARRWLRRRGRSPSQPSPGERLPAAAGSGRARRRSSSSARSPAAFVVWRKLGGRRVGRRTARLAAAPSARRARPSPSSADRLPAAA